MVDYDENEKTDQNQILENVRKFYKNIFKDNDKNLTTVNLNDIQGANNVTKLSEIQANDLEGDITESEILNVLKYEK